VLQLEHNNISSIGDIAQLTQLLRLKMNNNPIGDFEAFSKLTSLEYLILNDTNDDIADIPDSWPAQLTNLIIVNLRGNQGLSQSDTNVQRLHFDVCIPNGGTVYVNR
jgi:Leucine-rich repeat (LRR) protein